ncbi:MAG: MlaD family protein [Acetobacteraceae bacterium]
MGSRAVYVRVGVLIVIGIAAVVALVLFLGGANFRNAFKLETYFNESVQGLNVGAPVTYLGVTIGRVTDIGLVSAEYFRNAPANLRRATYRMVFVRFVIDPNRVGRTLTPGRIEDAVKAGFRTRIMTQGITGLSNLGLDFVNPQRYPPLEVPWSPRYPYVPSIPSTISQVQTAAEQIANQLKSIDFRDMATALLGLMDTLQKELTTGQTHQTLAATQALLSSLQNAVDQANLPELAGGIREDTEALGALLRGGKLEAIGTNADKAAAQIAAVAKTLPPLIAALSQTAARTNTTTAEFERRMIPILQNLAATASNLREVSETLRAYPAGALFGGPPPRNNNANANVNGNVNSGRGR